MRGVDFSSWQGVVSTLLGLVVVSLVAVGIRLLVMQRVQRRRERENRQINERLKTLIAAYKTLGGSFTGDLAVDPSHLRDLRARAASTAAPSSQDDSAHDASHGDRRRRVRDAVEACARRRRPARHRGAGAARGARLPTRWSPDAASRSPSSSFRSGRSSAMRSTSSRCRPSSSSRAKVRCALRR
jgi:heme exporter protein D